LKGKIPTEVAGIKVKAENKRLTVIQNAYSKERLRLESVSSP
jgi:hypothetical protein